ncbi:hypothetical protein [Halobacterium zhouii]|uniref:hypothetical protein n=1 Tax=Halobacterium zhouii TaxID=2902624 RepID=UPI001E520059|nr:hypothetical protein [Halobacterium zhouii]
MDQIRDDVIDTVQNHWERLLVDDFVEIVERHHADDEHGVEYDLVEEYFDDLAARADFDVGPMREQFEERLTDDQSFADEHAVYEVGEDRVSAYPLEFHEALDEGGSLADLVAAMTASMDDTAGSAAAAGVPEDGVVNAGSAILGTDRTEIRTRLEDLASEGELEIEASQHPRSGVSLAEDADVEEEGLDRPESDDRSSE